MNSLKGTRRRISSKSMEVMARLQSLLSRPRRQQPGSRVSPLVQALKFRAVKMNANRKWITAA
jgi:hypothetical protein